MSQHTDSLPIDTRTPTVEVPVDPELAAEPARTIGDLFADKKMIKPFISALVAVIATTTGWVADSAVIENLTTLVTTVAVFYAAWSAQADASKRAREQAEATREAVYAPDTVAKLTLRAMTAHGVDIVDVPEERWGVNRAKGRATV